MHANYHIDDDGYPACHDCHEHIRPALDGVTTCACEDPEQIED